MLIYLKVKNYAVVKEACVDFAPGLNVFTGETGAGKSLIVGALSLFVSKKIPSNSLRRNCEELMVECLFERDDEEFLLRREYKNKRSYCYLNDEPVPFSKIEQISLSFLNIYGQNEHLRLLNRNIQVEILDKYCDVKDILCLLSKALEKIKGVKKSIDELKGKEENIDERIEFLNYRIDEISSLNLKEEDEEELLRALNISSSAEEIKSYSSDLLSKLMEDEESVYSILAKLDSDLSHLSKHYPELQSHQESMKSFLEDIPELSQKLSNIESSIDIDPVELSEIENKVNQLNFLKNRYKKDLKGVLIIMEEMRAEKETISNLEFNLKQMERQLQTLFNNYIGINRDLRQKRKKGAQVLEKEIEKELRALEMPKAKFKIAIEEKKEDLDNIGERGCDNIDFLFSSNPGQDLMALKDVASGGELSRLMLAIKSLVHEGEETTYLFDEIDTGIGGKTAQFVGEKLLDIARNKQVICISHLPQIAAYAEKHFSVVKEYKGEETFSKAIVLDEEARVLEMARLMAGSEVDEDIIKAAKRLLQKEK